MASKGIRVAEEARRRGTSITISWVLGHAGVPGNEVADQWAVDAATREHRSRLGGRTASGPFTTSQDMSQAFSKAVLKRRATDRWRQMEGGDSQKKQG